MCVLRSRGGTDDFRSMGGRWFFVKNLLKMRGRAYNFVVNGKWKWYNQNYESKQPLNLPGWLDLEHTKLTRSKAEREY